MIFLPKWDQATSHFALYTLPLNKINAPYPIGIFSVFNQSIDKISTFFDAGKKNPQDLFLSLTMGIQIVIMIS